MMQDGTAGPIAYVRCLGAIIRCDTDCSSNGRKRAKREVFWIVLGCCMPVQIAVETAICAEIYNLITLTQTRPGERWNRKHLISMGLLTRRGYAFQFVRQFPAIYRKRLSTGIVPA